MAAYPRSLLEGILDAARSHGVPADVLIATTLVESGGRLDAVGDNGQSFGPFQENINGRGRGLTRAQSFDPRGSADRAGREFATFARQGLSGGALAAAAQRPADPVGYRAKVNARLPEARAILAAAGASPRAGGSTVVYGPGGIPQQGGGIPSEMQPGNNIFDRIPNPLDAAGAAIGFVKDFALKIIAFTLLGVIGVWLVGQGASKAFGTPAPAAVARTVATRGAA